jgi:hypothetical protein
MTLLLGDCYGAQDASTIQTAGFDGIMRYLSHQEGKCAVLWEIQADRAAGLIVGLNFEDGGTNALGGYQQGIYDATFAVAVAASLGYPAGCAIPFSVDFEAEWSNIGVVCAYFDACKLVCHNAGYLCGVYGSAFVLEQVLNGHADWGWQTLAWSAGYVSPLAGLYQSAIAWGGGTFDTNELLIPNSPLWGITQNPPVTPPPPPPPPPIQPQPQESAMASFLVHTTGTAAGPRSNKVEPNQVWAIDAGKAIHIMDDADLGVIEGQYGTQQPLSCATVAGYLK